MWGPGPGGRPGQRAGRGRPAARAGTRGARKQRPTTTASRGDKAWTEERRQGPGPGESGLGATGLLGAGPHRLFLPPAARRRRRRDSQSPPSRARTP